MLLKRRNPANWIETLRISIWPRRSWVRSSQYILKRMFRLGATPHAIAAGIAVGAFTSFTPLMGFHFCVALALSWLIRANLLAAALGTFVGNPLSFPFIWAASYSTGRLILQIEAPSSEKVADIGAVMSSVATATWNLDGTAAMTSVGKIWMPLLYPMLAGGSVLGLTFAIPCYFLVRKGVTFFRESRRNQLMKGAKESHAPSQPRPLSKTPVISS
ncbi:DUF2062 domain-containing protein [Candidatus Endowatersipora endosymbiont of Watersipora subatra]|uniref:DUF2062 domain-containing protein n=1 Tax=Candidatus Endowatersipora endosymbiont of Watersipora subatra TaxID=3077946 RepID=UPI00312CB904